MTNIYKKDGYYTETFIKHMNEYYKRYLKSITTSLFEIYENPSSQKIQAFYEHLQNATSTLKILSYNSFGFTVGYMKDNYFIVATHTVHETDEKRALKKAHKEVGFFNPIKTEKVGTLYVLEDEIFFKYAKPVENTEIVEEG